MDGIYITKDGFALPFGLLLNAKDSDIPFMAEIVEETDTVPGRDGEIQTGTRYGAMNHILVLRSWPDITEQEKDALKRQVADFMVKARTEPQRLHYERNRRTYYVKAVGEAERPQEYAGWVEFRLTLKAHDPFGYEDNERVYRTRGTLDVRGNEAAPARIEFAGPATNPQCKVDGVTYSYTGTVPSGSTLQVEALNATAVLVDSKGAVTNANKGWCGRYLWLKPGYNEVQSITGDLTAIYWTNRWA